MKAINILIIEDEAVAYRNLKRMLAANPSSINILGWLQSVDEAKQWFSNNNIPDLIFLDVQMGDGLSFSIFQDRAIECPVIFSTAYDEYALKAFELNSIDYLLKPFSQEQLDKAMYKYNQRIKQNEHPSTKTSNQLVVSQEQLMALMEQIQTETPEFKDRFHVKKGSRLVIIKTKDIAWFQRADYVFGMTHGGQKFMLDYSLDQIQEWLNPKDYYRLNRQFIGHIDAIQKIETFFNYKLKISLKPAPEEDVFVAKDKVRVFKEWLG